MSKVSVIQEASFVDMSDDALLELLGYLHEEVKNTDERMKADPEVQRMEEELKEYKNENYIEDKKAAAQKLKGVRLMAKARGLKFNPDGVRK